MPSDTSIAIVVAHPDDESFGAAGTASLYSARGVAVDLVCATRGEKGERLGVSPEADLGAVREKELRAAAAVMGLRDIYLLGYIDQQLKDVNQDVLTERIADILLKTRATVVITFGPDGVTGHEDHIAVGKAATRAFEKISDGHDWLKKLYWFTWPESSGSEVATRPDDEITTVIDIRGFLDRKVQAIAAHRSQPDVVEFLEELRKEDNADWAGKEYFYLANRKVTTRENDLFEHVED